MQPGYRALPLASLSDTELEPTDRPRSRKLWRICLLSFVGVLLFLVLCVVPKTSDGKSVRKGFEKGLTELLPAFGEAHATIEGVWDKGTIKGDALTWPSGMQTTIKVISPTELSLFYSGKTYDGKVQSDGKLHWSDGDVWVRVLITTTTKAMPSTVRKTTTIGITTTTSTATMTKEEKNKDEEEIAKAQPSDAKEEGNEGEKTETSNKKKYDGEENADEKAAKCKCLGGTPPAVGDNRCPSNGATFCLKCDDGYSKDGNQCKANSCHCPHGVTVRDGDSRCTSNGAIVCNMDSGPCHDGYRWDDDVGQCKASCNKPSTPGYDLAACDSTIAQANWNPACGTCAKGYAGSVTHTACGSAGAEWSVSGCQAAYETKKSGACAINITTLEECNAAAEILGLDDTTASDDDQSGNHYDPPYCYLEERSLMFNSDGSNSGACNIYDKCVCKASCSKPSTPGYDLAACDSTIAQTNWNPACGTCAQGYTGSVTHTVCGSDGAEWSVSGCQATTTTTSTEEEKNKGEEEIAKAQPSDAKEEGNGGENEKKDDEEENADEKAFGCLTGSGPGCKTCVAAAKRQSDTTCATRNAGFGLVKAAPWWQF